MSDRHHPTPNQMALLNALSGRAYLFHPRDAVYQVRIPGAPSPILYTTKQCFRACIKRRWIAATSKGADTYRITQDGIIARGRN